MSFYVHSSFKVLGSSAQQFNGVGGVAADPGIELLKLHAAGVIDPSAISIAQQRPNLSLAFCELKLAIDSFGLSGLKIPNSTVITGWEQYYAQCDANGTRVSGSNHAKLAGSYGMLVPNELSASQGNPAALGCTLHLGYDGTNAPWTLSTGVALLSNLYIAEHFTLGPVYINGTALTPETVQSTKITWNNAMFVKGGSGEIFPRRIHVNARDLQIEIATEKWSDLSTFGISGTKQGATASKIYFRKCDPDGSRIADATAEHVLATVTASQGIIYCGPRSGDVNNPHGGLIRIQCREGSGAVLSFNTASAIS